MDGLPFSWPQGIGSSNTALLDPMQWMKSFGAMTVPGMPAAAPSLDAAQFKIDPAKLLELQNDYTRDLGALWSSWASGRQATRADKRFGAESWTGPHAFFADLYLLNARFVYGMADAIDADAKTRAKIRFAVQQWVDAMAPSNYLALNPEALKKLVETNGESLRSGLSMMLADALKGRISMTDESAFEIGRNVATSEGQVVFENEIFQLIQYKALTATVFEKPLLIVPPCINKFYILDLQPENSLVRHAVTEGHTVFLVSWRNPTTEQAALTWDDYIEDGIIKSIDVTRDIAKQKTIDMLGFCVGGTMLTTGLAVLAARETGVDRGRVADVAGDAARLLRHRHPRRLRRRARSAARGADRRHRRGRGRLDARPRSRVVVLVPAAERPRLELRGQQLLEGRAAAAVRPAVLEFRQHEPARSVLRLVPAQHLSREPASRARRHVDARRAGRPRQDQVAGVHLRIPRGPHRAVDRGLREHAGADAGRSASCSARRATSPAS